MGSNQSYLVCIRCSTYNHAPYIEDALNGFTMQQTTFPYIAMVVDDASTDGEQKVIASYVDKYFDLNDQDVAYQEETDYAHITYAQHKTNKNCYIVVLLLKENHYQSGRNSKKIGYLATWRDYAKYEAICEGDDYWIDPLKLQKQVDFLETNPEYGMCYTRAKKYYHKDDKFGGTIGQANTEYLQVLKENTIPTLTVVANKSLIFRYRKEIKPETRNWKMGDYPMWLWFAHFSKIKFLDQVTSVYRILPNSASHSNAFLTKEKFVQSIFEIKLFFAEKYSPNLITMIEDQRNNSLMTNAMMYGLYAKAIEYYNLINHKTFKHLLKYLMCRYPILMKLYKG